MDKKPYDNIKRKYAKLILILVKQLVDLNFDKSYMTKSNQKPFSLYYLLYYYIYYKYKWGIPCEPYCSGVSA